MKKFTPYLPNLTPLRGVAALLVAVYHFEELIGLVVQPEHSLFFRKSYLLVDLFFIMSGFVMLHVYGKTFQQPFTRKSFRQFILARFARVYPLHIVTLLLSVGLFYALNGKPGLTNDPAAIPTNLLLLHSFGIHSALTWNIPSWSISAEWWAYILFPAIVLLLNSRAKTTVTIGLLLFTVAAYWAIEYYLPRLNPAAPLPHNLNVTYDYGFLRGMAGFVLGILTYQLFTRAKFRSVAGRDSVGLLFLAATVYSLHSGVNDALCIPLFAGLVLCFAANKDRIQTVCSYRPLQYLGEISYSMYMVHATLIFLLTVPILLSGNYVYTGAGNVQFAFGTGLLYCFAYLLIVVAVSSLTYRHIEVPARNYLNGLFKRQSQKKPMEEMAAEVSQR